MRVFKSHYILIIICFLFYQSLLSSYYPILIDPGHGGKDSGASGSLNGITYYEKDLNLEYALRFYNKIIQTIGHPVDPYITRARDEYLSRIDRVIMANNEDGNQRDGNGFYIPEGGVEIFISIHCNSSSDPGAHGTETYYHSSSDRGMKLATIVHQFYMESTRGVYSNAKSRWIKTYDNLTVLDSTNMPAILLETEFISNENSLAAMITDSYKDAVANGLSDAFFLIDPEWEWHCYGFEEITGDIQFSETWDGPVLTRNITPHGTFNSPNNPQPVTYYVTDSWLTVYETATVVLDDNVTFIAGTNGDITDWGARLIIGEGSNFNGITTGIEDYLYIVEAPNWWSI